MQPEEANYITLQRLSTIVNRKVGKSKIHQRRDPSAKLVGRRRLCFEKLVNSALVKLPRWLRWRHNPNVWPLFVG